MNKSYQLTGDLQVVHQESKTSKRPGSMKKLARYQRRLNDYTLKSMSREEIGHLVMNLDSVSVENSQEPIKKKSEYDESQAVNPSKCRFSIKKNKSLLKCSKRFQHNSRMSKVLKYFSRNESVISDSSKGSPNKI